MICDDGMRILEESKEPEGPAAAKARREYYEHHGIGWIARPGKGFHRAGRFKKASNLNYGLELSLKLEKHLARLQSSELELESARAAARLARNTLSPEVILGGWAEEEDEEPVEDLALDAAIEEVYQESGQKWRPMASNGRACRIGEIILLVDSDTVVPEDCLRDAAREMAECPDVGVIQHESGVLKVANNYFENGIAHFTKRINKSISFACANGEVAAFVGHNAFLRWSALQDAAFVDPADGKRKIWSESRVSEDFDMALRLMLAGYIVRWASYSNGGFKEGVSLTCDDELNRWVSKVI